MLSLACCFIACSFIGYWLVSLPTVHLFICFTVRTYAVFNRLDQLEGKALLIPPGASAHGTLQTKLGFRPVSFSDGLLFHKVDSFIMFTPHHLRSTNPLKRDFNSDLSNDCPQQKPACLWQVHLPQNHQIWKNILSHENVPSI